MVGAGVQCLDQHPEQAEQDGHLDYQRAKAAHWVHPGLPVHPHGFLGDPLAVAGVSLLNFPHSRLEIRHRLHLAQLLDGEGQRYQPDDDGEYDDGDAHVVEADGIQHHQQIQQGPDDYFSPEVVDTQRALPCRLPSPASGLTRSTG